VSQLSTLKIVAPAQQSLKLDVAGEDPPPQELWSGLPDTTQAALLSHFARLIARRMVTTEGQR